MELKVLKIKDEKGICCYAHARKRPPKSCEKERKAWALRKMAGKPTRTRLLYGKDDDEKELSVWGLNGGKKGSRSRPTSGTSSDMKRHPIGGGEEWEVGDTKTFRKKKSKKNVSRGGPKTGGNELGIQDTGSPRLCGKGKTEKISGRYTAVSGATVSAP